MHTARTPNDPPSAELKQWRSKVESALRERRLVKLFLALQLDAVISETAEMAMARTFLGEAAAKEESRRYWFMTNLAQLQVRAQQGNCKVS